MKRRLYKKALKWFVANRFCLFEPIPPIKGKHKRILWERWHKEAERMRNATKIIEKIVPDKKYTPRVFDELFKKNQSRIRKEKSVKIKI